MNIVALRRQEDMPVFIILSYFHERFDRFIKLMIVIAMHCHKDKPAPSYSGCMVRIVRKAAW